MAWQTSGAEAFETTDDEPVVLIAYAVMRHSENFGRIFNTGGVAGLYSLDGTSWGYLPANYELPLDRGCPIHSIRIKRFPGGSNLSGVYAEVW